MINPIELKLEENGKGAFVIDSGSERLAEMAIGIDKGNLTVYHTGVSDALKGKGVAVRLLAEMVGYARSHNLKVIPLCTFVQTQFKKHPELYRDIWNQQWHGKNRQI